MAKYLRKDSLKKYPSTHKKVTLWRSFWLALIMLLLLGNVFIYVFNMNDNKGSFLATGISLVLMGFYFLVYGVIGGVNKKKRCSLKVLAEIYDLKRKWDWNSRYKVYDYMPVYKFYIDGKEYMSRCEYYCSEFGWDEDRIGDKEEIMVNPNNPIEFRRRRENSKISIIGYGVLVVVNWVCGCATILSIL